LVGYNSADWAQNRAVVSPFIYNIIFFPPRLESIMAAQIVLHPEYECKVDELMAAFAVLPPEACARWHFYLRVLQTSKREGTTPETLFALLTIELDGCPWNKVASRGAETTLRQHRVR
jgi:hypothetical protein